MINSTAVFLFSLDGGEQSSCLKKLDGSLDQFVQIRETQPDTYFFGRNSIVHFLAHTAGKHPETLIIGTSAGGEIRAALAFSPTSIDAVEMVGSIIEAERNTFKDYGGGLYAHPKVKAVAGEGRSYLRSIDKKYDIIQMFSNHSSSSIAQGSGAAGTVYLQTEHNLVPNRFLQTPFPYDEAKALPWDITPVTDYSPYFGMIRKQAKILNPSSDIMLDKNTAY